MFMSRQQTVEDTARGESKNTLKMRQGSNIWRRHYRLQITRMKTSRKQIKMVERLLLLSSESAVFCFAI